VPAIARPAREAEDHAFPRGPRRNRR
jgi:hypothetical protein